jgi:hypothetical protein
MSKKIAHTGLTAVAEAMAAKVELQDCEPYGSTSPL